MASTSDTSSTPAGRAHPGMAYAPVSPSDQGDGLGEQPDRKPYKWYFSFMVLIRLITLGLAVAGIAVQAVSFRYPMGLFVLGMFIHSSVLAWNAGVLVYGLVKLVKKAGGHCPSVIIQVGSCRLSCGDEEDDGEEGHRLLSSSSVGGARTQSSTPQRRCKLAWIRPVYDGSLAAMLLCGVLAEVLSQSARRRYYWWSTYHQDAVIGLMSTMMFLQVILALLAYTRFSKAMTCFAYADDDDKETYQIRLPQDPQSSKAIRNVSIVA